MESVKPAYTYLQQGYPKHSSQSWNNIECAPCKPDLRVPGGREVLTLNTGQEADVRLCASIPVGTSSNKFSRLSCRAMGRLSRLTEPQMVSMLFVRLILRVTEMTSALGFQSNVLHIPAHLSRLECEPLTKANPRLSRNKCCGSTKPRIKGTAVKGPSELTKALEQRVGERSRGH